ncbi:unnamed protein product [Ostreobium quekettii]|uniref:Uncharacterized protein n=1 Tax=Ostreobium quekettii TaxID=121088 RepID=A0A8S1J552_9CHLO|nr:unnamed protein product [Ostreobium quekettii]
MDAEIGLDASVYLLAWWTHSFQALRTVPLHHRGSCTVFLCGSHVETMRTLGCVSPSCTLAWFTQGRGKGVYGMFVEKCVAIADWCVANRATLTSFNLATCLLESVV